MTNNKDKPNKIRKEVTCSKCFKVRYVEYWPLDEQDKLDFLKDINSKPYVCSDCGDW